MRVSVGFTPREREGCQGEGGRLTPESFPLTMKADNETGFSHRMVDLTRYVGERL